MEGGPGDLNDAKVWWCGAADDRMAKEGRAVEGRRQDGVEAASVASDQRNQPRRGNAAQKRETMSVSFKALCRWKAVLMATIMHDKNCIFDS